MLDIKTIRFILCGLIWSTSLFESSANAAGIQDEKQTQGVESIAIVTSPPRTWFYQHYFEYDQIRGTTEKLLKLEGNIVNDNVISGFGIKAYNNDMRLIADVSRVNARSILDTVKPNLQALVDAELSTKISKLPWLEKTELITLSEFSSKPNGVYAGKWNDLVAFIRYQINMSAEFSTLSFTAEIDFYESPYQGLSPESSKYQLRKASKKITGNHKAFYDATATVSLYLAPTMDFTRRERGKEEIELKHKEIVAHYQSLYDDAKASEKKDIGNEMKGKLRRLKERHAYVESENYLGQMWYWNDGELLKNSIDKYASELADLIHIVLSGSKLPKSNGETKYSEYTGNDYDRNVYASINRQSNK